jgi:hypothetical protein
VGGERVLGRTVPATGLAGQAGANAPLISWITLNAATGLLRPFSSRFPRSSSRRDRFDRSSDAAADTGPIAPGPYVAKPIYKQVCRRPIFQRSCIQYLGGVEIIGVLDHLNETLQRLDIECCG